MNYMLLVYVPERPAEMTAPPEGCAGLAERLESEGKLVDAAILRETACATSVSVRQGRRLVTDGPFAETREQLAGYMVIDVPNLDEAIAVAAQHPCSEYGTVEIRPFWLQPMALSRAARVSESNP